MGDRTIPQRELRNNVAAILRAAEAGETFTVTVRGRPVARVVPADLGRPRVDVDRETLKRILELPIDDELAAELEAAEAPVVGCGKSSWRDPCRLLKIGKAASQGGPCHVRRADVLTRRVHPTAEGEG